jgi:hypothetical protein
VITQGVAGVFGAEPTTALQDWHDVIDERRQLVGQCRAHDGEAVDAPASCHAANLTDRMKGAELNGWLGEVAGLRTSRDAAAKKLTSLDRSTTLAHRTASSQTDLGFPTLNAT